LKLPRFNFKKNIDPETIDLVIGCYHYTRYACCSNCSLCSFIYRGTNAFAYDLNAACSGFLYGMSTSAAYISSGRYKKVLLIGADKMSSIVDYTDRTTCIIFGDGGGAVFLNQAPMNLDGKMNILEAMEKNVCHFALKLEDLYILHLKKLRK